MKNAKIILFLASLYFLFPGISFGQVTKIETGDTIGYSVSDAKQTGNQPIVFPVMALRVLKLSIEKNGDRRYLFENGSVFSVTDNFFTKFVNRGEQVKSEYRFRLFPMNQKPEPGMKWKTDYRYLAGSYGDNQVNFRAVAKNGPAIVVMVDGKETTVRTVSVEYEGSIDSTRYPWHGRAESSLLYSPDLDEIVSSKYISYDDKGFLMTGSTLVIKYVMKANKPELNPATAK